MCFSATASFASAAALVSIGAFSITKSRVLPKQYLIIAIVPFLFGMQQFVEGYLWLSLDVEPLESTRATALSYMFFSHFFWLFWVPLISYMFEHNVQRKRVFLGFMMLGGLYGLSMYLPLLFNADWLAVVKIRYSINYEAVLIYDGYLPRGIVRALYAVLVMVPLVLSSDLRLRRFGYIVAVSVLIAAVFYGYAFISVWCFFAGLLSIYFAYLVLEQSRKVNAGTL